MKSIPAAAAILLAGVGAMTLIGVTPSFAEDGKCIELRTQCPGKGWVTTSCDDPDPCGLKRGSSVPASGSDEAARRQQQDAAAEEAGRAELERKAVEDRQKAEVAKEAEFLRQRDRGARELKGSSGGGAGGLRGVTGSPRLKGTETSNDRVEKKRLEPLQDSSVVDGRGPRDGSYLLSRVPELAQSPAADRIEKGFQGVINHDWAVALVWWQEALQRDPKNASLVRAVDLAQSMVDRRPPPAGPVVADAALTAAIQAAARGENAEAIRQFEIAKARTPSIAPGVDRMIAEIELKSARAVRLANDGYKFELMLRDYAQDTCDGGLFLVLSGNHEAADENFRKAEYLSRSLPPEQRPVGCPSPSAAPKK